MEALRSVSHKVLAAAKLSSVLRLHTVWDVQEERQQTQAAEPGTPTT